MADTTGFMGGGGSSYTNKNIATATQTSINDISQGNISFGNKSPLNNKWFLGTVAVVAALYFFKR